MVTHEKLHNYYESKIKGHYKSEELFVSMVGIVQETDPKMSDDEAFERVMKYLEHRMETKFGSKVV